MNDALYQQDTEIEILSLLLPFIENKMFIDVGAEKGTFANFVLSHGFSGTLFEPCPKHHGTLTKICRDAPARFYPYAIDSEEREADFFINLDENDEPSDYYHSLQHLPDDPNVNHRDRIRVTCRTLGGLMKEGIVPDRPGLVKIDTEGNDLRVMQGMAGMFPEVIICEFLTPGLYSGWESAAPEGLIREADAMGYRHYLAIKRASGQELVSMGPAVFGDRQWGNLVFMRDEIYTAALASLNEVVAKSEARLFSAPLKTGEQKDSEIQKLQATCEERLTLINYLHEEAAKRLDIIAQLKEQAAQPKEKKDI